MTDQPTDIAPTAHRHRRRIAALAAVALVAGTAAVGIAQIDSGNRGIQPINSNQDLAITGIEVDVTGRNAEDARMRGWQEAQRKGWAQLYRQMNRSSGAPAIGDSALNSIVSAIVVEQEQIGPRRYIAKLGILFDRVRAGQILGVSGRVLRSPPLLVLPVYAIDGMPQVFETRNEWQRAWAQYRTGDSSIDYVRTAGTGPDTLLLNAGQPTRRSRVWWRVILDQYGAADVLMPTARIEAAYPGGPITGHFAARYGPDNELLGSFRMTGPSPRALPDMMRKAVAQMDALYVAALSSGRLRADPSLVIEAPVEEVGPIEEETTDTAAAVATDDGDAIAAPAAPSSITVTVQFDTPDAESVSATERAVAAIDGVGAATTSSLALGGTSVMRVTYRGDLEALKSALSARGFAVQEGGGALRISR